MTKNRLSRIRSEPLFGLRSLATCAVYWFIRTRFGTWLRLVTMKRNGQNYAPIATTISRTMSYRPNNGVSFGGTP